MSVVYVYSSSDGLVKIVRRGNFYYVYRLDKIYYDYRTKKKKFVFERHYCDKIPYKPYKDDEVSYTPDVFFEDVKRMEFYKIIPMLMKERRR